MLELRLTKYSFRVHDQSIFDIDYFLSEVIYKMTWTWQAWIILAVYLIVALILSGTALAQGTAGALVALIVLIVIGLTGLLLAYDTNCLSAGECNVWSWIRTFLFILNPIAIGFMLLAYPQTASDYFTAGQQQ